MRTYYRDKHVHITSQAFHIDDSCYPLDQLGEVWRTRRSVAVRRVLIGLGIVAAAVLVRVAASYIWWLGGLGRAVGHWIRDDPVTVTIVAALGLGVGVLGVLAIEAVLSAIEDIRGFGRNLELWANIEGHPVLLFRTNDSVRFGQICRALIRARSG
jgi:hypothetical protein